MFKLIILILLFSYIKAANKIFLKDINKFNKTDFKTAEAKATHVFAGADFIFPDGATRRNKISNGEYVSKNMIATRIQYSRDKLIAIFPRYKNGVVATVGITNARKLSPNSVKWEAFPTWDAQSIGNCDAIQSAVDIVIDKEGRAWILDSGIVNTLEDPSRKCPPKIVVVSLKSRKIVRLIDLSRLTNEISKVQYLALDQTKDGHTFVYVSDATNNCIIVWDVLHITGWKVMLPQVAASHDTSKDILYITQSRLYDFRKSLYFTYLSSSQVFSIRTEYLRKMHNKARVISHGKKPGAIIILGNDGLHSIFFRFEGNNYIFKWNTNDPFNSEHFELVYTGQENRLTTHIVPDYLRNKMMLIESNFQDFMRSKVGAGTSHTISPMVTFFHKIKQ